MNILESLHKGDSVEFERLLESVDDIDALDEDGWTLLHWTAGQGDVERARSVMARGADVFKKGSDDRTPYLVALAAGHSEMADYLLTAEKENGGDQSCTSSRQVERRAYCKAYSLGDLKRFDSWEDADLSDPPAESSDAAKALKDDEIVFIHQDYSVTRSVLHGDQVLFSSDSPEWRSFCRDRLAFKVPTDLEMLAGS